VQELPEHQGTEANREKHLLRAIEQTIEAASNDKACVIIIK
jgi:hypothetical protein